MIESVIYIKRFLKLRRQGKFYYSYEDDAYIIYSLMDYRLINGRIGFPINSLGKVCNKLDDCKISYIVIDGEEEKKQDFGKRNNYDKFLKDSIDRYHHNNSLEKLIDKVNRASNEELEDIINYIRKRLGEE